MNRSILPLLLALLSFAANAQYSYVPMNLTDGQWRHRLVTKYQNISASYEDYMLLCGADTVIASLTYKKILKRRHYEYGPINFTVPLKDFIADAPDYSYAYVREDNKKVYRFMNGTDTVLYNFNLQVNDTLPTPFEIETPTFYQPVYVIHSIDTISVNGSLRKRFSAHGIVTMSDTVTVVEGIGSNHGFLMDGISGPYGQYLLTMDFYCFTAPGIQYPANSNSCYYIWNSSTPASVNDIVTEVKTNVYPNPFINVLHIDTKEQGFMTIYTATGIQVIQKTIASSHAAINTSTWSSGVYFMVLKNKSGQVTYKQTVIK